MHAKFCVCTASQERILIIYAGRGGGGICKQSFFCTLAIYHLISYFKSLSYGIFNLGRLHFLQ